MSGDPEGSGRFQVRAYRPEDRPVIRRICADTGFLGKPIDPVFEDRELFADFLTAPYTDAEPENCFVLEGPNGAVEGYLTASSDAKKRRRYMVKNLPGWLARVLKGLGGGYGPSTRKYLWWLILRGRRETPAAPREAAHFHINLLPQVKSVMAVRSLIDEFLAAAGQRGIRCVYGQIVTRGDRRGERMFARYGFRVTDRKRVTKFQSYSKEEVTLCTVVKDLAESPLLYGKDLQREGGRKHGRSEKKLLLSLHDFHPGSRPQIGDQLEFCLKRCPGRASILVIPEYHHGRGVESCAESLRNLEKWQREGHDLALHGYFHDRRDCRRIPGFGPGFTPIRRRSFSGLIRRRRSHGSIGPWRSGGGRAGRRRVLSPPVGCRSQARMPSCGEKDWPTPVGLPRCCIWRTGRETGLGRAPIACGPPGGGAWPSVGSRFGRRGGVDGNWYGSACTRRTWRWVL